MASEESEYLRGVKSTVEDQLFHRTATSYDFAAFPFATATWMSHSHNWSQEEFVAQLAEGYSRLLEAFPNDDILGQIDMLISNCREVETDSHIADWRIPLLERVRAAISPQE